MKTKIKFIMILAVLFSFTACNVDDDNVVIAPGEKANIVSPEQGASITLTPDNPDNPALTVVWNHAKYSVGTEINYTVEVAKGGTLFAAPFTAGITSARQLTLSVEQLNSLTNDAGLLPFEAGELDIRVKATIGTSNTMQSISEKVTISITPYTTALPLLAVPGNHQGWDPPTAPRLAASAYGATDFEGFVWLDGDYKFLLPNASGVFQWGNTDFGDDGSFSGILVQGSPTNCNVGTAGYYYVKANTKATGPGALSYSADPASWAITGAATPNGWPDPAPDHDMTYNPATKKWTITLTLSAGEFKFRANNAWSLNLGDDNNGDGFMDFGGPNLSIATPGTYTVTLDLSNPRAYSYSVQ